jgi:hypothetical protein
MEALSVSDIPVAAIAELFVAAVLSWICFSIHKTLRDPRTPPAEGVMLDPGLGLLTVTAERLGELPRPGRWRGPWAIAPDLGPWPLRA